MDSLYGCPKGQGVEVVLRTMTPDFIAVDEITSEEDSAAILRAYGCGVGLLATAHAAGMGDFRRREIYGALIQNHVFDTFLVLHPDKTFHLEGNSL